MEDNRYLGRLTDAEYSEGVRRDARRRTRDLERMTEEEYLDIWNGEPPVEKTEKEKTNDKQ